MANILTQLSTTSAGGYATSRTVSSFTPAASRLLLAWTYFTTAGPTISSITGHGTWSLIRLSVSASNAMEVWGCITSGSPGASTVVVNHASAASAVIIEQVDATYSGASVAASVIQSNQNSNYDGAGGSHAHAVSLSTFGSASNSVAYSTWTNGGATTYTNGGSLNTATNYTTAPYNVRTASNSASDTNPTITSSGDFRNWCAVAFELALVGGGAPAVVVPDFMTQFNRRHSGRYM